MAEANQYKIGLIVRITIMGNNLAFVGEVISHDNNSCWNVWFPRINATVPVPYISLTLM